MSSGGCFRSRCLNVLYIPSFVVDGAATLFGLKPTTRESRIKQLELSCPRGSSPIIRDVGGFSDILDVFRLDIR
jgi:hypothetical protein